MHLGKELLRTCLAGLTVHLVVVSACSAGGGGDGDGPELRLATGSDAGRTTADPANAEQARPTDRRDAGQAPSLLLPVAEAKANESGSRLKARWFVGDDAAREFVGWFDSELKTECAFSRGRDGLLRCLPTSGATPLYTTSDCTGPLVYSVPVSSCDTHPAVGILAADIAPNACAATSNRYFSLSDEVVPEATYFLSGSLCKTVDVDSAHTYWTQGAELHPSRFVSAEIVTE
ncbi:MAG: hypothetical protein RL685_4596 [Pseudomonadota bacterium]|jgi:hypothetical protein